MVTLFLAVLSYIGFSSNNEKPQWSKHLLADLWAGLMVFCMSMPLSPGVSEGSGAQPFAGLLTAIVGGLSAPLFRASRLAVFGPAAGLMPVLLAQSIILGGEAKGYVADMFVAFALFAILQVVSGKLKLAGFFAKWFCPAAIEGMLCVIGLTVMVGRMPVFLGVDFAAKGFWPMFFETFSQFPFANAEVLVIGAISVAIIIVFVKWVKVVPPQLVVVVFGLSWVLVLGLESKFRIQLPSDPLDHFRQISLPDFAAIFSDPIRCLKILRAAVLIFLIASIESLATTEAVDAMAAQRVKSDPNRVLFTNGLINFFLACLGALPGINESARSVVSFKSGAKSEWASFFNACFLLGALLLGVGIINLLPLPALAAIVAAVGFGLSWRSCGHLPRFSKVEVLAFFTTVLVTTFIDLAVGIIAGIIVNKLAAKLGWSKKSEQPIVAEPEPSTAACEAAT